MTFRNLSVSVIAIMFAALIIAVISCSDGKDGKILGPGSNGEDSLPAYEITEHLRIGFAEALDFGTYRDSVYISILNDSSGTIIWDIRSSASWLYIEPDSGTGEAMVKFKVNRAAMQPGIHRDAVKIFSNGGEAEVLVEVIIPADTTAVSISEYWPFALGNKWIWLDRGNGYWWAFDVVDSAVIDSFVLWNVLAEDAYGGSGSFWFTIANNKLTVLTDSSRAHDLHGASYTIVCNAVDCWGEGNRIFGLFEADLKPGIGMDPFWRNGIQYVPGSLNELLSLYPVWQAGTLTDTFFVSGNVENCIGLRETKAAGDSLYTILAPGWGPVLWDSWTMVYAEINGSVYGYKPATLQAYHLAENDDTLSELLFWFRNYDGTNIYVMGYRDSGMTAPNHIVWEDETGEPAGTVVFRADFMPVMWITDGATMSVRNINPDTASGTDTAWDPGTAFYFTVHDTGEAPDLVIDIYPHTPYSVFDSLQKLWDWTSYYGIASLMRDVGIETWEDLAAAAWIPGENQIWWQSAAMFVGMGATIVAFEMGERVAPLAKRHIAGIRVPGPAQDMAKKIGEYLKDEAMCKWCPKPGLPTIQMLQCQGVKAVLWHGQVCHDSYMYGKTALQCLDLCHVTMKCFTNICMPRHVAVEDFEKVLFENNLKLTPSEARDLLKQNIDALKPYL